MTNAHTMEDLKIMQKLPLSIKIRMTEQRIRDWVNEFGQDGVYVSFSGGKDSTVLLDIVRNRCGFKDVPAVFIDTGLEYPEIRDFVKTFDNVVWLKPKTTFKQVIEKYGYPFFGKETASTVYGARRYMKGLKKLQEKNIILDRQTDSRIIGSHCIADILNIPRIGEKKESQEYLDLQNGIFPKFSYEFQKISGEKVWSPIRYKILMGDLDHKEKGQLTGEKSNRYNKRRYIFMLDAPFEISDKCCGVMKKSPAHKYQKETGKNPITAQMADESYLRQSNWLKSGCNIFDAKHPISNPMSFWTEQDVLKYIKENNIPICSVYGEIVPDMPDECDGQISIEDLGLMPDNRKLKTTGCQRTGCMFCGFGCQREKAGDGRFERMKVTHPKLYDYIMRPKEKGGLNYKEVIDWINEHGGFNIKY